ncbi:MAG: HEAT repeat domain-containing protein [Chthoniobacter sp.]|uniref:HEAT repeat domain-containing protein n=1 Tax=Chthoniobacter sp. TaxID=2510640 RepID=UPI0032AD07F1
MSWKFPRALAAGLFSSLLVTGVLAEDAPPSINKLTEQLASKDLPARREAAFQLLHLGAAAKPALPALLKALDDDDKQIWSYVIQAIAAIGPDAQEAIPVLIERFDSRKGRGKRERDLRQGMMRTAYALSRIGAPAVPPLIQALGEGDGSLRMGATRALGAMGPAAHDAVPALIKNLADNQDPLRDESAQTLALIGANAGPALVTALQDSEARRRTGAANALALMNPPFQAGAKDVEQAATNEKDPLARTALLAALPKTGVPPDRCVALILPAVTDENETLRHAALNALLSNSAVRQAAVPKLAALLKDNNPAVRERAARALGRVGPGAVDALPTLLQAARTADGAPAYADALAQIGPKALPALLDILQKSKPAESKWVLRILHSFGPPAVPVLAEALKSNTPEVRIAAANALAEMGHEADTAAKSLFVSTKDSSPAVQAAAFRALVAVHADSGRLKPLLQEALTDKDPQVRRAAAAGMAALGGAAALGVDGLVDLLSDDNPAGRIAAVQALGQLGDKAAPAVNALISRLDDPVLQSSVVEALGHIGPAAAPAVPRLVEMAKSKKDDQRTSILPVLTGIGPGAKEALPLIYEAVRDSAPDVRASAATALASVETDNGKAITVLAPLARSTESGKVRRAVAHALAKYGPAASAAVPGLITMLEKETERGEAMRALKAIGVKNVPDLLAMLSVNDPRVKTFACESLGSLGPEAKDAAPKLREVAAQDGALRASANAALKKIDPSAP